VNRYLSSVGAAAVLAGVSLAVATPAFAGPASPSNEAGFVQQFEKNFGVKFDNKTSQEALNLGYTICKVDKQNPSKLNHSHWAVASAEVWLCDSTSVPTGASQINEDELLRAQQHMSSEHDRTIDAILDEGHHHDDY
jgi:hypothetical protein